jgi:hypothetical protein
MTLDEIRVVRQEAEAKIKEVLRELQAATGIYPDRVIVNSMGLLDADTGREWNEVESVRIGLERL